MKRGEREEEGMEKTKRMTEGRREEDKRGQRGWREREGAV